MFLKTQEIKVEDIGKASLTDENIPRGYKVRHAYNVRDAMFLSQLSYPVQVTITRKDESMTVIFCGDYDYSNDMYYSSNVISSQTFRKTYGRAMKYTDEIGFFTITSPRPYSRKMIPTEQETRLLDAIAKFLSGQIPVAPGEIIIEKSDAYYYPRYIDICMHNYCFAIDELHLVGSVDRTIRIEYGPRHSSFILFGNHPDGYDFVEFKSGKKIRFAFDRPADWRH